MFSFSIPLASEETAVKVLGLLIKNSVAVKAYRPVEVDLEEVFLQVTHQHGNES